MPNGDPLRGLLIAHASPRDGVARIKRNLISGILRRKRRFLLHGERTRERRHTRSAEKAADGDGDAGGGKNGWLYLSVIKTAAKNKQTRARARGSEDERPPCDLGHHPRGTAVTSPGAQINDLGRLSIQISAGCALLPLAGPDLPACWVIVKKYTKCPPRVHPHGERTAAIRALKQYTSLYPVSLLNLLETRQCALRESRTRS